MSLGPENSSGHRYDAERQEKKRPETPGSGFVSSSVEALPHTALSAVLARYPREDVHGYLEWFGRDPELLEAFKGTWSKH